MSPPRPDTNDIKEIIERETQLDWTVNTDEPDHLSFVAVSYKIQVVWDGDSWVLEYYDSATPSGDSEPQARLGGNIRNATEVKQELPEFLQESF